MQNDLGSSIDGDSAMNDALRNVFVKNLGNLWKKRAKKTLFFWLFLQYVSLKVGAASRLGQGHLDMNLDTLCCQTCFDGSTILVP